MLQTCRTCFVEIRDTSYIKLNDNDVKSRSVRAEFLGCVPELDLNLVEDPVICRNCVNILQLAYCFKTRCLLMEKRIRNCLRNAELNGKPVTLTKLLRFSKETNTGKHCSRINGSVVRGSNDVNSGPTAGERFPAQPERASLDIEADNGEHEKTDNYITYTENKDSNVVMSSEVSLVDGEDENDLQNIITNDGAITGSTLQPLEFQDKISGSSSAATCTNILGETSQDFNNTIDDIIKVEHELTFKRETDEALSFKEEDFNNGEEARSNECKTGTWDNVKEETRSITDDADRNDLVDNEEYELPAATRDGENFVGSNSINLNNQIKEYRLNVRRLSTESNCSRELYSDSATSSEANITEKNVSSVNYEEERTNNCNTSSLCKENNAYTVSSHEISQRVSVTNEYSLTKEEEKLKTFKPKEPLNEKKGKDCTVDRGFSIKECSVNLQRLDLSDLVNKSSFNAYKLLNLTSAKSLQATNRRHNRSNNLSKHERAHSTKKSFSCKVCKYSTTLKRSLVRHMHFHTSEGPFECKVCYYRAVDKYHLTKHMRTHTGEKPFQCNVCEYSTVCKQHLISHVRTHTDERPFRCNVCKYSSAQKQHLIRHMRRHTGEKPYQCEVCDYSAAEKQHIIRHMRTHTGEKPYQCEVCEYSAIQKHHLIIHMRTHTGEKPFQCNVCDYKTIQKQSLINHLGTHTNKKQFQCKVCEYSAVQKFKLISHMRSHSGERPFQCKVCDYKAVYKQNLFVHMRTHSGEKPFPCTVCDYRAGHKHHLTSHMRIHAGEKPL